MFKKSKNEFCNKNIKGELREFLDLTDKDMFNFKQVIISLEAIKNSGLEISVNEHKQLCIQDKSELHKKDECSRYHG